MESAKWTKEESIIVLDLFFQIPFGVKAKNDPSVIMLAKLFGRTPAAIVKLMCNFSHWHPTIPLYIEETDEQACDLYQPFWNDYFQDKRKLKKEAKALLDEVSIYTLVLALYFYLVADTMTPKVSEVTTLAKMVKKSPDYIVEILHNYLACDPFTAGKIPQASISLHKKCAPIWERFHNRIPALTKASEYLMDYYTNKQYKRPKT